VGTGPQSGAQVPVPVCCGVPDREVICFCSEFKSGTVYSSLGACHCRLRGGDKACQTETAWSDDSSDPPTTLSSNPVWWSLEPLGVIRGGVVAGGGTTGGHLSGRERAAQPKHTYSPWLSADCAIILLTLVSPSPCRDTVTTSCCFRKLICMSDSDAFPCSFWTLKKTVAGSVHSGHA